ncbi:hypothetical protein D3C85_1415960 [compost metagenome]
MVSPKRSARLSTWGMEMLFITSMIDTFPPRSASNNPSSKEPFGVFTTAPTDCRVIRKRWAVATFISRRRVSCERLSFSPAYSKAFNIRNAFMTDKLTGVAMDYLRLVSMFA